MQAKSIDSELMAEGANVEGLSTMALGPAASPSPEAELRDYVLLLKPRVMSLVIFTAFVGLMAAPVSVHPLIAFAGLLCVAVGAGASGALNMWYDADIDAHMERTRKRPIPAGRVSAGEALAFGTGLSVLSVLLLSVFANPVAGAMLGATIGFYVFIYTMWLKRRTPYNIVIGGAAGAFPPMIGWAIATGEVSVESAILFAVIFLWTPPHSWALALFRNDDYSKVGVPMLPAAAGPAEARRQIWLYSLVLAPVALAPLATSMAGWPYGVVAILATAEFLVQARAVSRRSEADAEADKFRAEKRFFGCSIRFLFMLFLALLLDPAVQGLAAMALN